MKSLVLNNENFDEQVLKNSLPVLVEFGADWCGSCHILAPVLEELSNDFNGEIQIAWLDVDENQQLKSRYGIFELPTFLFFKNGEIFDHIIGVVPKNKIREKISNVLKQ